MQREYCAELALAEGEPIAGTADVVDVWIMLEYAARMDRQSDDRQFARGADARMARISLRSEVSARGLKPRLQLIRRPETRSHAA